jgi:hypothetical protein
VAATATPLDPGVAALPPTATPIPVALTKLDATAVATTAQDALTTDGRRQVLSFRQLGALDPLQLRGVDSQNGVPFSVRADEVVTGATLHLIYSYSPSLLANLSHLKVLINGEMVAALPLPREQAGMLVTRDIPIEPRLVTEFNHLNIELIGHYIQQCEDPASTALWATVSNASSLDLSFASLATKPDLRNLPLPFFDRRDVRRLELPFVFAAQPDARTLEAAGVVASWFGSLAGYRGAVFPAQINSLPPGGNAVVFATNAEHPAGLAIPHVDGPTLMVVDRGAATRGKLLLVLGRDPAELKTAATALALGRATLSGASAEIGRIDTLKPRQPDDAPNWLTTSRPVHFGELVDARELRASGYDADSVRVNVRMPPDLFMWNTRGVPVDLKYRYTARPNPDKSTLNISVNNTFVQALRIPAVSASLFDPGHWVNDLMPDHTAEARHALYLPPRLMTSRSQLSFHFFYELPKASDCQGLVLDNVRGTINPDSTIDLSGFPHYMALPDLATFANSGFPFARMADLSETAAIMPNLPDSGDYSLYLLVMGRMGESTGYPVTGVTVANAADAAKLADKDLLLFGAPGNQPLLSTWQRSMPFSSANGTGRFTLSDVVFKVSDWWHGEHGPVRLPARADLSLVTADQDALLMGFESPLQAGRSVVALVAKGAQSQHDMTAALLDADVLREIQGALAVVQGRTVSVISNGQPYFVGRLPPVEYLHWALSMHPLLLVLACLLAAFIIALFLYRALRAVAARRLRD